MTRWKVLVTAPRAAGSIDKYEAALGAIGCEVIAEIPLERHSEDSMLRLVGDVDAIVCGDDHVTRRVIDCAPRLRAIVKWGTGIDSIDVEYARQRGIAVCNSPGAFSDAVADTVLGYIVLFARKLDRMAEDMRAGAWRRLELRALCECTLGIVGLGNIGRAVARRALACGMTVLSTTQDGTPAEPPLDTDVRLVPLSELLASSDFVTLHADLRAGNRHLIDAAGLRTMKPTAVLINTARGGLVDEEALIAALREGRIGGAALDVFSAEPLDAESPLRTLANVYLAPHNANASLLAADRVHANSIEHVLRELQRLPPVQR